MRNNGKGKQAVTCSKVPWSELNWGHCSPGAPLPRSYFIFSPVPAAACPTQPFYARRTRVSVYVNVNIPPSQTVSWCAFSQVVWINLIHYYSFMNLPLNYTCPGASYSVSPSFLLAHFRVSAVSHSLKLSCIFSSAILFSFLLSPTFIFSWPCWQRFSGQLRTDPIHNLPDLFTSLSPSPTSFFVHSSPLPVPSPLFDP